LGETRRVHKWIKHIHKQQILHLFSLNYNYNFLVFLLLPEEQSKHFATPGKKTKWQNSAHAALRDTG